MRKAALSVATAAFALLAAAACAHAAVPWPHGDPDAIVKTVLAQPAYHGVATSDVKPPETLLDVIIRRIGDFLRWIFGSFARALRGAQTAGAAFGIALIIALVALLILAIARVAKFAGRRPRTRAGAVAGATPLAALGAAGWLDRARAAAQRGDFAAGIAALFNAALHSLDERGIAPFDDARTPSEYRALLRRVPDAPAAAFDRIARSFVIASFSRARPGAAEFDEANEAYRQLAGGVR
jgi:hypothetical protein